MISSDIIRGHLEAVILKLVIEKDCYGYEISKKIALRTQERFEIKEATLYAVIQRLEKREFIVSYYGDETQGGRRKYYTITNLGKAFYQEKLQEWKDTQEIINLLMEEQS